MKVVHIESGLGNQMLSYCEYLALKKLHPEEDIFIENIVYDIPEANAVIKQWNGYELERIFGIKAPNVKELFTDEQWKSIMDDIRQSLWWEKNWNYPVYFTDALNRAGLNLRNIRGDFEEKGATRNVNMKSERKPSMRERLIDTSLMSWLRREYRWYKRNERAERSNHFNEVFYKGCDDIFTGQWLSMKFYGGGIEKIERKVRETFRFPKFNDKRNTDMAQFLSDCESVAIHARRGDMLGCNAYCYKHGYFRRAVKHIRRNVNNPIFAFFCDPGSVDWCRENGEIFGLDFNADKVLFVDWNKGTDSYRDMQLMTYCKHNIITNSSFGWWGAWLNQNPDKITISPKEECFVNTTYHC